MDATAPGRVLPNVSKMLALWDLDGETFRDVALRDCAKLKPIVERMKVNAEGLAALTAEIPVNSVVSFELSRHH